MTSKELIEANNIDKEIKELDLFIWTAERVWTGKIIKKDTKYIFKTNSHGVIDSAEFNMNTEIKDKVLDVLRNHLKDLKIRLENI